MAIRYDDSLNQRINQVVKNYNRKVKRINPEGKKSLLKTTSVYELKGRYSSRSDLIKELNRLESFTKKGGLSPFVLSSGEKVNEWEVSYIKTNLENAKTYYENERSRIEKRVGKYPGERTFIDNINAKLNLLNTDLTDLSKSQFRSVVATINEYAKQPSYVRSGYRGFLNEVDWAMGMIGYSEKEKNKLFNKLKALSPYQFLYAYNNNDIVSRIYELYHKDYDGDPRLNVSEEDARVLMDIFLNQIDDIIKDAIENAG